MIISLSDLQHAYINLTPNLMETPNSMNMKINLLDLRFLPYITNTNLFLPKKRIKVRNFVFNSRDAIKVGRSETFSTATYIGRFWITFFWWIIWLWSLVGILATWFQVHGKNFKVKHQFLISLEAFKVGRLEFFSTAKPKTPFYLGPHCI